MEVRQGNVLLRECECRGALLECRFVEQNGALLEENDRETLIRAEGTLVKDLEQERQARLDERVCFLLTTPDRHTNVQGCLLLCVLLHTLAPILIRERHHTLLRVTIAPRHI